MTIFKLFQAPQYLKNAANLLKFSLDVSNKSYIINVT